MKSCLARDAGAVVPGKVGAGELNKHPAPPLSPSACEADAEVAIANLPGGANVSVTVSARNATGESQPSAPVTAIVP
jgi:hypothetical protein